MINPKLPYTTKLVMEVIEEVKAEMEKLKPKTEIGEVKV